MHIDERNPLQERVDQFAVLFVASMLAEQLFQLKGSISIWMTLLLGLMGMVTLRGIYFQRGFLILFTTGVAFIVTAYFTGQGLGVVRSDVVSILQGAVFIVFVSLSKVSLRRREAFWLLLHRSFALLGGIAGYLGLAKLFLMNQGVILDFFYTEDGVYPPGASLNGDYNFFSLGLIIAAGSSAWLIQNDRSYVFYLVSHVGIPGMISAMLLTSSRRALVFVAIGVVAVLFSIIRKKARATSSATEALRRRGRWVVVAAYFVVALSVLASSGSIIAKFQAFLNEQEVRQVTDRARTLGTEEAIEGRTLYWDATFKILEDSSPGQWLLGGGFGYVLEMGSIGGVTEDYPHNFLLSAILYGGVFQLLLTLLLLARSLFACWWAGPTHRVVLFWLSMLCLFHLSSSNSLFSTELFPIVIALALDLGVKHDRTFAQTLAVRPRAVRASP